MKSSLLLLFMMFHAIVMFSQVESYTVDASKTYENKTQINYLTLSGNLDDESREHIQLYMDKHPDVLKFSFYSPGNKMKCMFKINMSLDNDIMLALMNDAIYNLQESKVNISEDEEIKEEIETGEFIEESQRIFVDSFFINGFYKVSFKLDGISNEDLMQEISLVFKNSDIISDVNLVSASKWELYSKTPLNPSDIEEIIQQWGLTINSEYIK